METVYCCSFFSPHHSNYNHYNYYHCYNHSDFIISNTSRNFDKVTPCRGAKYRWGIKISPFSIQDSDVVTIKVEQEYGTSLNDLEWPLTQIWRSRYYLTPNDTIKSRTWSMERRHFWWPWTQFSRSRYFLTLDISQTAKNTAMVTINCE